LKTELEAEFADKIECTMTGGRSSSFEVLSISADGKTTTELHSKLKSGAWPNHGAIIEKLTKLLE